MKNSFGLFILFFVLVGCKGQGYRGAGNGQSNNGFANNAKPAPFLVYAQPVSEIAESKPNLPPDVAPGGVEPVKPKPGPAVNHGITNDMLNRFDPAKVADTCFYEAFPTGTLGMEVPTELSPFFESLEWNLAVEREIRSQLRVSDDAVWTEFSKTPKYASMRDEVGMISLAKAPNYFRHAYNE